MLAGLYTWIKDKSGTKLKWIQSIIELVRKQTEAGVASLKTMLEDLVDGSLIGMSETSQLLKPRLEDLLYKGYESLSDHQTYLDWVKDYREKSQKDEEPGVIQPRDKVSSVLNSGWLTQTHTNL